MSRSCRPSSRPSRRLALVGLEDRTAPATTYGQLPLAFEADAADADFLARGPGYAVAIRPAEVTLGVRTEAASALVGLKLVGSNPLARPTGQDLLPTRTNYFLGDDPDQWRTDVPNYGKVTYADVYPGIDVVYYGNQRQLEYDFVVAPGASPGAIALSVEGADRVRLNARGDLVLHTPGGKLIQKAPVLFQEVDGARRSVPGRFVLDGTEVRFRVGRYDHTRPLVIDPVLSYSTYLGGSSGDQAHAVAVDGQGNAYVAGYTYSANFPTAGAVQPGFGGQYDAFVTKLNPTGTQALYSTYLGGAGEDWADGTAVDGAGNAYVTGSTLSANFPVTAGALQTNLPNGAAKAFVTKLGPTGGAMAYSTYLGGSDGSWTRGRAIAVDADGNAFVTGDTDSFAFPLVGAAQPVHGDGTWGAGTDAFVSKLNPTGTALVYSTYLGGAGYDVGYGIALDAAGSAYVTGGTEATGPAVLGTGGNPFPTTPGAFQRPTRPPTAGPRFRSSPSSARPGRRSSTRRSSPGRTGTATGRQVLRWARTGSPT